MDSYGIERGDVLLSLQLVLTNEEELAGLPRTVDTHPSLSPGVASRAPVREGMRSAIPAIRTGSKARPGPSLPPMPPAPSRAVVMVDPLTGAGTLQALRRDLGLHGERNSGGAAVVALDFKALDQIRLVLGDGSADDVVKGLVEVAPFALRARDRVYRSGRDQLMLVLPGADDEVVEAARWGLEMALGRFLSDRGFPEVRLGARRVDPASLAG